MGPPYPLAPILPLSNANTPPSNTNTPLLAQTRPALNLALRLLQVPDYYRPVPSYGPRQFSPSSSDMPPSLTQTRLSNF